MKALRRGFWMIPPFFSVVTFISPHLVWAQEIKVGTWKTAQTILFVTHDVDKAVTLADRIIVMDKSPGRIREEIHISLPRPRKVEKTEYLLYRRKLYESLRD